MSWPDPQRPGFPLHRNQDSDGHVLRVDGRIDVWRWDAAHGVFRDSKSRWVDPASLVADDDEYLGQIVTPAEVAAKVEAEREANAALADQWAQDATLPPKMPATEYEILRSEGAIDASLGIAAAIRARPAGEQPMRRLTVEGDPITRMAVIRDADTGEALWAGPADDVRRAVRQIRDKESRDAD